MRTVIFINAHSRKARDLAPRVEADFNKSGLPYEVIDVIIIKRKKEIRNAFRSLKSSAKDAQCVIVGGGDGTITSVFNELKNLNIIYGFLPLGTGNIFMKSLKLPVEYTSALEVLKTAKPRDISLGKVDDKLFANMTAIGISARVAQGVSDKTKRILGESAYVLKGLWELTRHKAFSCELKTDQKSHVFTTHHLLIANGHYQGPYPVGSEASVYKNQLVAVAFGVGQSKLTYAKAIYSFWRGTHKENSGVKIIPFKHAQLLTKPKRTIEVDGEPFKKTPVELSILSNNVKVLVQPDSRKHKLQDNS